MQQAWLDLYSPTLAAQIESNLNKLVVDFTQVLKMINIELDCLGSKIGSISISGVNTYTIGTKLNDLFT